MFRRHKNNADFLEFLNRSCGTKDTDNDGIADEVEEMIGTDPLNSDSDNDGYNDGEEIIMNRNPLGSGKLRDFFTPHKGNNYQSNALHPHRLFFYGLSAILIKIIVVIFIISFPMVAWLSPDVLYEQGQKIIDLTNELRQRVGVQKLTENKTLTESAYAKANDMLLYQYFAHVGPNKRSLANWLEDYKYNYVVAGENLAMGFSSSNDVVDAWIRSKTHYANLIDPDFSQIGVGVISGPYFGRDTTLIAQFFAYPSYTKISKVVSETDSLLSNERSVVVLPKNKHYNKNYKDDNIDYEDDNIDYEDNQKYKNNIESKVAGEQLGKKINVVKSVDKPRLISPIDGVITNKEKIELNIWAPDVESVMVYSDGKLIANKEKNKDISLEKINIELTEGKHALIIESLDSNKKIDISPIYQIIIDKTAPTFDQEMTLLEIRQSDGSNDAMINFVTNLSPDTSSAQLSFAGYKLDLQNVKDNKWSKKSIIFKKDLFNTIVLANLTLEDKAGNISVHDIGLDYITPSKTSLSDKYSFLKSYPTKNMKMIFDLSSLFYKILLVIAVFVLGVNIFIEIKRQNPKIIIYTGALIVLLLLLIIL